MRFIIFLIISINFSKSQEYQLTCFGIHIGDIKQTISEDGKIEYDIQSRGIADLIWPTNNSYYAFFDTKTFSLRSWGKKVKQGLSKSSLDAEVDSINHILKYGKEKVKTVESTHTVFTMLAMVQNIPFNILDTKWFPYEHQGRIGRARFLWSDSSMVWTGKDSIMSDHYRMDIIILDSTFSVKVEGDYFMDNIFDENYVREIWVRRGKKRKVIKASVTNNWVTFIARTNR